MKDLICRYCGKKIEKDQLRTAIRRMKMVPFHKECFELQEEETISMNEMWKPVNQTGWTITSGAMLLFAITMAMTEWLGNIGDLLGVFALYPVIIRFISLVVYETR
ncbi:MULTISPECIES: hypothetical protein [Pontibacillus]|uniref:CXXC-20-CXXC protein n=1 Tax=Pontibacillus chungwhensis TaxID=265426 RepID=A0ABY8V1Z6_9BACI|nr:MULTISPECIES: hypothetical protein [Pontibacillus]MCD5324830.1 hypothetical protein [Pontibacillus sp. HN14]WIF98789.1 hypothetical protein QNI29_03810 [Pontibacillus chungwhensis]